MFLKDAAYSRFLGNSVTRGLLQLLYLTLTLFFDECSEQYLRGAQILLFVKSRAYLHGIGLELLFGSKISTLALNHDLT